MNEREVAAIPSWIQEVHRSYRKQPFVGTLAVYSAGGGLDVRRVVQAETARMMEALDAEGYWRAHSRCDLGDAVAHCPAMQVMWLPRADGVLSGYRIMHSTKRSAVAGHPVACVHFHPVDRFRHAYRLCADRATGFPLRIETLSFEGEELAWSEFSSIYYGNGRPLASDEEWEALRVASRDGQLGESPLSRVLVEEDMRSSGQEVLPAWIPAGFSLRRSTPHLVYSDGVATFSVLSERVPRELRPSRASSAFPAAGSGARLRRRGRFYLGVRTGPNGMKVAVVGELSPAGVERILGSMRVVAETPGGRNPGE